MNFYLLHLGHIIAAVRQPMLLLDPEHYVILANKAFHAVLVPENLELTNVPLPALWRSRFEVKGFGNVLQGVLESGEAVDDYEMATVSKNDELERIIINIQSLNDGATGNNYLMLSIEPKVRIAVLPPEPNMLQSIFELALQKSTHIVFTQDKQLRHTYIFNSDPFFKLENAVGKTDLELHEPVSAQKLTALKQRVIDSGAHIHEQLQLLISDQEKHYDLFVAPLKAAGGEVEGIAGVGIDVTCQVTALREMERAEQRFRSLADALPQLVWMTNSLGSFEFASSQWVKYSGLDPYDRATSSLMVHPDDLQTIIDTFKKCVEAELSFRTEVRLKNKYGKYRWFMATGEPVTNSSGAVLYWIGAFTDIHEHKLKDEKKDEFIGVASHEMRTPLTTAKAYLQLLEKAFADIDPTARLYAHKALESIDKLNNLINELMEVSKIQNGKLSFNITSFDFNEFIDHTIETIQHSFIRHKVRKSGNVSSFVSGDKDRLQQVLINLLNNAVKYSPDAAAVDVHIKETANTIEVAVTDTGIGIAPEHLHKLFERYYRVEEHKEHFEGLGIGLFICFDIIERHHGRLWVISEPGQGSTFSFSLPINRKA